MTSLIEPELKTPLLHQPEYALPDGDERGLVGYMEIPRAADDWLDELARRGRSSRTIDGYRRILNRFADILGPVDIREVTTTQIRRYLDKTAMNARVWDASKRKGNGTRAVEITVINGFFDWLTSEQYVKANPTRRHGQRILARPKKTNPIDNDNIVSVTSTDVRRMLAVCEDWDEKLCMFTLAYLGPRRHALAMAKITDYDAGGDVIPARKGAKADAELAAAAAEIGVALPDVPAQAPRKRPATITFREKGSKTISKPCPPALSALIDAALEAGVYAEQDWLVPNRQPGFGHAKWLPSVGRETRSDRVVYDIVKRIADRANVKAHVHSLRAAFAVYFLEQGGDKYDLQLLMGHASGATTDVYARRLDKQQRMRSVLNLDWGEAR